MTERIMWLLKSLLFSTLSIYRNRSQEGSYFFTLPTPRGPDSGEHSGEVGSDLKIATLYVAVTFSQYAPFFFLLTDL